MLSATRRRHARDRYEEVDDRRASSPSPAAGLVGDVAKFMLTRSLLRRVARVGGIQGIVISAAATYAIDRFLTRRR